MVAMRSSLAGEMVWNGVPCPATNSPSMKRPYSSRRFRIDRDSGAGAYSRKLMSVCFRSVDRHVVGAGVVPGAQLLALQEHVVQEAGGAEPEQVRLQPALPDGLGDGHEVLDGV